MNSRRVQFDFDFWVMIGGLLMIGFLCCKTVLAAETHTLRLKSEVIGKIRVTPGRSTVLSFPSKPLKVILGNKGVFAIQYVENDLAIAALTPGAQSNMFVYLEGRRFAFDLRAVPSGGDEMVFIRDDKDRLTEVQLK